MKQAFMQFFIPKQKYQTVSLKIKKQLPFLIITSIFLEIALIALIFVSLLSSKGKFSYFETIVLISFVIIFSSLVLIKTGKYILSCWLLTLSVLALSLAALFLMHYSVSLFEPYRPLAFGAVMFSVVMLISIEKKQIFVFSLIWILGWCISFATIFKSLFLIDKQTTTAILLVGILGFFVESMIFILTRNLSDTIIGIAEDQTDKATKALQQINTLLIETSQGIEIGQHIQQASNTLHNSVGSVFSLQEYLSTSSKNLIQESHNFSNTSKRVDQSIEAMKSNLDAQSAAIIQTSAAMTEISSNIQNISFIATKRTDSLKDIQKGAIDQQVLIKELLQAIELVKKSTEGINGFIETVEDIASRTGLLSMNASIESARAGSAGKGFSIIAQEIRGLSEETQRNALTIKQILTENNLTVETAAKMTKNFAEYIQKNSDETNLFAQSMDEILQGIAEMNVGTQEVSDAVKNIVETGSSSTELIQEVVLNSKEQKKGFEVITNFVQELHTRIEYLQSSIQDIHKVSTEIAEAGEQNSIQVQKIKNHLQA